MTDGLVKHEGVVSINDVPPHPSTATDSNMCTFLSVMLCVSHTHTQKHVSLHKKPCTRTHPLKVPVQYIHRNTHTDLHVYTEPAAAHTHTSPAHSCCTALLCNSLSASMLLLMWENTALRNKSCPPEHEGIEFSTCSYGFSSEGLVQLYGTGSHVKVDFVQVICGFSPSFTVFSCFNTKVDPALHMSVSSFFCGGAKPTTYLPLAHAFTVT